MPPQTASASLHSSSPFTPNGSGTVTITITNTSSGFIDFTAAGSLSSLKPNTHYGVWFCNQGGGCSSNTNLSVITDSSGNSGFSGSASNNQTKYPLESVKVWEQLPDGVEFDPAASCYSANGNSSPACLQGNISL